MNLEETPLKISMVRSSHAPMVIKSREDIGIELIILWPCSYFACCGKKWCGVGPLLEDKTLGCCPLEYPDNVIIDMRI